MRAYFDTETQNPSREDCAWIAKAYRTLLRAEGKLDHGPMRIEASADGVKLNAWAAEALLRHIAQQIVRGRRYGSGTNAY